MFSRIYQSSQVSVTQFQRVTCSAARPLEHVALTRIADSVGHTIASARSATSPIRCSTHKVGRVFRLLAPVSSDGMAADILCFRSAYRVFFQKKLIVVLDWGESNPMPHVRWRSPKVARSEIVGRYGLFHSPKIVEGRRRRGQEWGQEWGQATTIRRLCLQRFSNAQRSVHSRSGSYAKSLKSVVSYAFRFRCVHQRSWALTYRLA